jgi:hypothetical protein
MVRIRKEESMRDEEERRGRGGKKMEETRRDCELK